MIFVVLGCFDRYIFDYIGSELSNITVAVQLVRPAKAGLAKETCTPCRGAQPSPGISNIFLQTPIVQGEREA